MCIIFFSTDHYQFNHIQLHIFYRNSGKIIPYYYITLTYLSTTANKSMFSKLQYQNESVHGSSFICKIQFTMIKTKLFYYNLKHGYNESNMPFDIWDCLKEKLWWYITSWCDHPKKHKSFPSLKFLRLWAYWFIEDKDFCLEYLLKHDRFSSIKEKLKLIGFFQHQKRSRNSKQTWFCYFVRSKMTFAVRIP
jgi:hypothetical protein